MTSRMKIIDDHTGREIPVGARYYNLTIVGAADNGSYTRYTYRDVRTATGVMDTLRAALAQSQMRREQYPNLDQSHIRIEIHERTA